MIFLASFATVAKSIIVFGKWKKKNSSSSSSSASAVPAAAATPAIPWKWGPLSRISRHNKLIESCATRTKSSHKLSLLLLCFERGKKKLRWLCLSRWWRSWTWPKHSFYSFLPFFVWLVVIIFWSHIAVSDQDLVKHFVLDCTLYCRSWLSESWHSIYRLCDWSWILIPESSVIQYKTWWSIVSYWEEECCAISFSSREGLRKPLVIKDCWGRVGRRTNTYLYANLVKNCWRSRRNTLVPGTV